MKSHSSKCLIQRNTQPRTQELSVGATSHALRYAHLVSFLRRGPAHRFLLKHRAAASRAAADGAGVSLWAALRPPPRSRYRKGRGSLSGYAPGRRSSVRGDNVSEGRTVFPWPWHLIVMRKRKGMTACEAKSMEFLSISYDLISLPLTYGGFLCSDSCICANSVAARTLTAQWKAADGSIVCSIPRLFYPQSQIHVFFLREEISVFNFLCIELKIYLVTKRIDG